MSYISAQLTSDDIVTVWERRDDGDRVAVEYSTKEFYYFYVKDPDGTKRTMFGDKVSLVKCRSRRDMNQMRDAAIKADPKGVFESDIPPELRVLSNHYYEKTPPNLNVSFFDIEVDYDPEIGFSSVKNPYAPINALAIINQWTNTCYALVVPPPGVDVDAASLSSDVFDISPAAYDLKVHIEVMPTERDLLYRFLQLIEDSDLLCGWNSEFFDMPYTTKRIEKVLGVKAANRLCFPGAKPPSWRDVEQFKKFSKRDSVPNPDDLTPVVDLHGRIHADMLILYKKYEPGERFSFSLSAIEQEVGLDLPKLEYEGTLADLYKKNLAYFVRYNIRDAEILLGFERTLGYVDLSNRMYHLSTGLFQHVPGTLKLAELAIVNYCHHVLQVAVPNIRRSDIDRAIAGAYVLFPQVGLHKNVGSIDINSLYPTAIRSINMSPETIRGQFLECGKAVIEMALRSQTELTLVFEDGGRHVTATAEEWREYLVGCRWAVSGYGTVFDQAKPGIIPSILTEWFATRKKYQALKKEAEKTVKTMSDEYGDCPMPPDVKAEFDKASANIDYYDRLQYVFKIKLNSLYGALTNLYFRFYDLRLGESTTATGRMVLKHQCRKASEVLDGEYNVEFPLYEHVKDALEMGHGPEVALYGPVFNGKYQAPSIVYGDTDSTYFLTHTDNIDDAVAVADAVAEKVNQSYQAFMQDQFLCTSKFDDLVKAARELVADNGIFVDKKRYILHIVDKEGKRITDPKKDLKVMGLDTKKTTIPRHVGDTLNGFVRSLLVGSTWDDVAQTIVEYKDQLRSSPNILDIGLPKGANNVEMYHRLHQGNPSTNLPGHIAAAIHYNECLKLYNDKESPAIKSGMKVKVYYLMEPNGRFKSIALPTDIKQVPGWFMEHFQIDYDAHILRLVDNPLENILKAIGKKTPTRQSIFVDTVFEF